jgi:hypothetical protein
MKKIHSSQLEQTLRTLSAIVATEIQAKKKRPQMQAAIALHAPHLTIEEKAIVHSVVVSQIAAEFGVVAHRSSKVHPAFGFYAQTFNENTENGKNANMAVSRTTLPLRIKTVEAAAKYAAKKLAPKVTRKLNSADKVARALKPFAKLTLAQQSAFMAGAKALMRKAA